MADEDVTVRMSLKDDASRPLRGVEEQAKRTTDAIKKTGSSSTYLDRTGGSARSLEKDLASVHRTAIGLSSSLGGAFVTGLRWGAIGIAGLGVAVTGFGIKAVSQFQQAQTALDTLTGSVAAGHDLFRSLQDYDLSTAFDFAQITSAAQTLEQFNVSGKQTLPVLKALGDVAANTSDPSGNLTRMALAIGQISSSGVLRAQDLNQLVQAGFPAYQLASSASGVAPAALRKQMESGGMTLPAADYLKAITEYSGPLGRYKGAALAQGQTLAGALSNAPGQIRKTLAETATPYTDEFTTLIKDFTTGTTAMIREVGPGLFKLAADIGHLVVDELPKAEPVLMAIFNGLDRLVTEAGPVMDQVLGPLGGDIGAGITQMVDGLVPVLPDLVEGTVGFVMILPDLVALLGDMIAISAPVVGFIDDMLQIDIVRKGFAGLLLVLLGYRALAGVIGIVTGLSGAIMGLARAQAVATETSAAGGAGAALGRYGTGAAAAAGGPAGLALSASPFVGMLEFGAGKDFAGGKTGPLGALSLASGAGLAGAIWQWARGRSSVSPAGAVGAGGGNVAYNLGGISVDARGMTPTQGYTVGRSIGAGVESYVDERAARR